MDREELLTAATAYFGRPGFHRLLAGLAAKYRSLNRLGGVVVLSDPTAEERAELEALLRRRLAPGAIRVSAREFAAALAATKFGALDPKEVLERWLGSELISNQERRRRRDEQRILLLERLTARFPHPLCQKWLQALLAKETNIRWAPDGNVAPAFVADLELALQAISRLPAEYQRLPVFAQEVCGDPHGLDSDRDAGKLFLEALRFLRNEEAKTAKTGPEPDNDRPMSSAEEVGELLYHFRLLRDDVLNFATCYGLAAYAGTSELIYWRAAATAGAPLNIPLREIVRVTAVRPLAAPARPDDLFDVYLVENSGVFSALLDALSTAAVPTAAARPLVCLHGQFKLASWALLDRLIASGAVLHYSGDFDPEGLQIAQKLLCRYPGRVRLWRLTATDYAAARPAAPLDERRLKKLAAVDHPVLAPLAKHIAARRLAAYQEGILPLLAADLAYLASGVGG